MKKRYGISALRVCGSSSNFVLSLKSMLGPERFDDAMEYVEKYRLHETALSIWKNTENYDVRNNPIFETET